MHSPPERERSIFSFQTIVDFVLILLGHALGLDHHDALLIFRTNVLKHAKTEGFFQQRELRKTDTAREVCVGMAAQIAVDGRPGSMVFGVLAYASQVTGPTPVATWPGSCPSRTVCTSRNYCTGRPLQQRILPDTDPFKCTGLPAARSPSRQHALLRSVNWSQS